MLVLYQKKLPKFQFFAFVFFFEKYWLTRVYRASWTGNILYKMDERIPGLKVFSKINGKINRKLCRDPGDRYFWRERMRSLGNRLICWFHGMGCHGKGCHGFGSFSGHHKRADPGKNKRFSDDRIERWFKLSSQKSMNMVYKQINLTIWQILSYQLSKIRIKIQYLYNIC